MRIIRRHYTATAIGICIFAAVSITDNIVSADQPPYGGRGIFRSSRLPWNSPSAAGSSVHNNNNNDKNTLELTTRGGAAASTRSSRRPPIKGAASSTAAKRGGVKKMKKMVKKRVVSGNAKTNNNKGPNKDTMPSIFRIPSEEKYDRYAAALAITEGLRRVRDADVARAEKIYKETSRKGGRNNTKKNNNTQKVGDKFAEVLSQPEPLSPKKILDSAKQQAESAFLLQSTKAVKSLGMTVAQFNQIGREVLSDPALKERVSEQAYLYRIHASAMSLEKVPLLSTGNDADNENQDVLKNHKRHQVQMFARSIQEIEDLRTDQLHQLQSQLRMTQFPPNFDLSDPNVQPLLRDEVRAVCERFPAKAEEIVKRYGLESEEFNKMLEETRGNPIFRWRVMKTVRGVEEERKNKKKKK